jgi:hypothetical protein
MTGQLAESLVAVIRIRFIVVSGLVQDGLQIVPVSGKVGRHGNGSGFFARSLDTDALAEGFLCTGVI